MGLLLSRLKQLELGHGPNCSADFADQNSPEKYQKTSIKFPDLEEIPTELSLKILKCLNATDLCLAACVWSSLANDDTLWQGLCKSTWGYLSIYEKSQESGKNFRRIFMLMDEATLTFNVDWKKGLEYLFEKELLENNPMEIAKFINSTQKLSSEQKKKLFSENKQVLENLIIMHNFENQFLPTALRKLFSKLEAHSDRTSNLAFLLEKFSKRFCSCNPKLGLNEDSVYILCFSLVILSVDLSNPAIKNKMSKREFIKNTRNALPDLNQDFTGHLYDNVYLNGSIAKFQRKDDNLVSIR